MPEADVAGIAGDQLRSYVERLERLGEERKALGDDIAEVHAEARGSGFDSKIIKRILKIRAMDQAEFDEQETLLDLYKRALGMLPAFESEYPVDTPATTEARAAVQVHLHETPMAAIVAEVTPGGFQAVPAREVSPGIFCGDLAAEPPPEAAECQITDLSVDFVFKAEIPPVPAGTWKDERGRAHTGQYLNGTALQIAFDEGLLGFAPNTKLYAGEPAGQAAAYSTYWKLGWKEGERRYEEARRSQASLRRAG